MKDELGFDLTRPIARHRLIAYLAVLSLTGAVFTGMTIGVGTGIIPANRTSDVIANLLFGIPVVLVPFVLFWDAPGEQRTRLHKLVELVVIYLPYTAGSQLMYELPFLVGHPFNAWTVTNDPGWKWLWWQYGLADHRYRSDNNGIFGLEFPSVLVGLMLVTVWFQLLSRKVSDQRRIICLWLAFAGLASLCGTSTAYLVSEFRAGFSDIGEGAFGLWFKFVFENVFYFVLPYFVLYGIVQQVTFLMRRVARQEIEAEQGSGPAATAYLGSSRASAAST